jgi:hypothetical protein
MNKIRNGKEDITTDITEIQRIIKDNYEWLHGNKLKNLDEMDTFLDIHNLPKLNYGQKTWTDQ